MMQQGNEPINPSRFSGRFQVPISPLEGVSKVGKSLAGAMMQQDTYKKQADLYQQQGRSDLASPARQRAQQLSPK